MKTFRQFISDRRIFPRGALVGREWEAWHGFANALQGLPPESSEQAALIARCTGLEPAAIPRDEATEVLVIAGRRAGKTRVAAKVALYLAIALQYPTLAAGEVGVVMVIAADRRQARQILSYIRGDLNSSPMLRKAVVSETASRIEFDTRIAVEIHTASFRAVRGYTVVGAICDELAFWSSEGSANPDSEVLSSLRPAMSTIPGAVLMSITSPYARKGEAWRLYDKNFGRPDARVLVWQADTRTMNPTVPQAIIDEAYERDPAVAAAEYGAQWRRDVENIVPREIVEHAVVSGRDELPPTPDIEYVAFIDPAGGTGSDSMTLAIAHRRGDQAIVDLVREVRPPFDPDAEIRGFCELLALYGLSRVVADRYAGDWVAARARANGVAYDASERPKSQLYIDLVPLLTARRVELLDNARLVDQLANLERRPGRSGRDTIDHPLRRHDDVANAVAGAVTLAVAARSQIVLLGDPDEPSRPMQLRGNYTRSPSDRLRREHRNRPRLSGFLGR
jgi:hypothetical protein